MEVVHVAKGVGVEVPAVRLELVVEQPKNGSAAQEPALLCLEVHGSAYPDCEITLQDVSGRRLKLR
eukprot:4399233-Heterocapsa_arctica.AAC.1